MNLPVVLPLDTKLISSSWKCRCAIVSCTKKANITGQGGIGWGSNAMFPGGRQELDGWHFFQGAARYRARVRALSTADYG